jgi:hypothetical protein
VNAITWIFDVLKYNADHPTEYVARFGFRLWRLRARFTWRRSANLWGRFGGGWNWKVGIQVGGRTAIVSLLVADLAFDILSKGDT